MDLYTIQEQMEKAMLWFTQNYEQLATLKGQYEQKKDFTKTQLAICEMLVEGKTQKEIERKALANEEYIAHLEDLALKRTEYLKMNCQWEAKKAALESLRSLNKNLQ